MVETPGSQGASCYRLNLLRTYVYAQDISASYSVPGPSGVDLVATYSISSQLSPNGISFTYDVLFLSLNAVSVFLVHTFVCIPGVHASLFDALALSLTWSILFRIHALLCSFVCLLVCCYVCIYYSGYRLHTHKHTRTHKHTHAHTHTHTHTHSTLLSLLSPYRNTASPSGLLTH